MSLFENWYNRRKSYWKQMSRSKLAKDIDRNFHVVACVKGRRKAIMSLWIDRDEVLCHRRIKNKVMSFYKKLYK